MSVTGQWGHWWYHWLGTPQGIPRALGLLLATEYQCPSIAKQESQDALEIPDEPPCYVKNSTHLQVLLVLFHN